MGRQLRRRGLQSVDPRFSHQKIACLAWTAYPERSENSGSLALIMVAIRQLLALHDSTVVVADVDFPSRHAGPASPYHDHNEN